MRRLRAGRGFASGNQDTPIPANMRATNSHPVLLSAALWLVAVPAASAQATSPAPATTAPATTTAPVPAAAPAPAAAAAPIDYGTSIRPATLRAEPDPAAAALGDLPIGTPVALLERRRLWVRVQPQSAAPSAPAWAPLLSFRFGPPAAAAGAPAAATGGGGVAGFSRSVSGLLAGFRGRQAGYGSTDTATIGIRGLTSAELGSAAPDLQALAELDRHAVSPQDAQAYAFAGGLVPQRLPYLDTAPATPATAPATRPNPFR